MDSIPTTDFWFGLMLLLLFQTCRAARYVQKNLGEKPALGEQFGVWWRLASPYFLESFPTLVATLMLARVGGSDTLYFRASGTQSVTPLLVLAGILIFLCPLCGSVLGWKLSESRMPVLVPLLAASYFNLVAVPFTFGLHGVLERETFPLLHVLLVTATALLFLLYCCRSKPNWFDTRQPPHSTFLLACLGPAILLTMEEPSCGFTFERFPIFVFVGVLSASAVLMERKA